MVQNGPAKPQKKVMMQPKKVLKMQQNGPKKRLKKVQMR
jgi:hypothetical protein